MAVAIWAKRKVAEPSSAHWACIEITNKKRDIYAIILLTVFLLFSALNSHEKYYSPTFAPHAAVEDVHYHSLQLKAHRIALPPAFRTTWPVSAPATLFLEVVSSSHYGQVTAAAQRGETEEARRRLWNGCPLLRCRGSGPRCSSCHPIWPPCESGSTGRGSLGPATKPMWGRGTGPA